MRVTRLSRPRRRRAVILVLSLWIAIVLSVMAYSVAYELRISLRLAKQSHSKLKARAIARAGIAKAVMDLRNDKMLALAEPASLLSDSYADIWAQSEDKTEIEVGEDGSYTVFIEDEQGKFNLSTLNPINAPVLGHLLHKVIGMDAIEAQTLAFMLLDWQDPDFIPSLTSEGDESRYYTKWAKRTFRRAIPDDWEFRPKNDRLMSLDELLTMPFFTRTLLFGDPDLIYQRANADRFDIRESSPVLSDYLTVQSSSAQGTQLNINTMPSHLMEAMLRMVLPAGLGAEDFAREFHEYRMRRLRFEGGRGAIGNIRELEAIGLGPVEIGGLQNIMPLTTASGTYTITSRGTYRGIEKTIQMRVSVIAESYPIDPEDSRSHGRRDRRAGASIEKRFRQVLDPAVRVIEMRDL